MDIIGDYFVQFDYLNPKEIEIFKKNTSLLNWESGTLLEYDEKLRNKGGFILSGLVRLYSIMENGSENTIWIADEGSLVGNPASALNSDALPIHLHVIEDSTVMLFNHEELSRLELEYPRLAIYKCRNLERELCEIWDRMCFFATMNPEQRFEYLMKHKPLLFDRVQQQYLASYIGVTDVSMSRIKKRYMEKSAE